MLPLVCSDVDIANDPLEIVGTLLQQLALAVIDVRFQLALDALGTDDVEDTEADIVDTKLAVQHGGHGQRAIHAPENAFADVAGGDGDGDVGL